MSKSSEVYTCPSKWTAITLMVEWKRLFGPCLHPPAFLLKRSRRRGRKKLFASHLALVYETSCKTPVLQCCDINISARHAAWAVCCSHYTWVILWVCTSWVHFHVTRLSRTVWQLPFLSCFPENIKITQMKNWLKQKRVTVKKIVTCITWYSICTCLEC